MRKILVFIITLYILLNLPTFSIGQNVSNNENENNSELRKYNNSFQIIPGFVYKNNPSDDYYTLTILPGISYSHAIFDNYGIDLNCAGKKVISNSSDEKDNFHFYNFGIGLTYYSDSFYKNSFLISIGNSYNYEENNFVSSDLKLKVGVRKIYTEIICIDVFLGIGYTFYERDEFKKNNYFPMLGIGIGVLF